MSNDFPPMIGKYKISGVIFVNDRGIRIKEQKLNSVNANFYAVMQGLDSVLISFDSDGIVQTWNNNAERYFEIQQADILGKNLYETVTAFKQFKAFFDQVLYSQKRQYNFHENMHINKGPSRIVDMLCVPLLTNSKGQKSKKALLVKMDDVTTFATDESNAIRIRNANLISAGMEQVVKESAALNAEAGGMLQALNELAEAHSIADEVTPYTAYLNNMLAELSVIPQKYAATLHMNKFNNVQTFWPIIAVVALAFVTMTTYLILFLALKNTTDIKQYFLAFFIPAALLLLVDVLLFYLRSKQLMKYLQNEDAVVQNAEEKMKQIKEKYGK